MQLPRKTNAAAAAACKFGRLHSLILLSLNLEVSGGGKDPAAAAEPAGPRTCLIELYSNNLHHISGSSSEVLMSETGEGQILPFFPSLLAGFAGAV